MEGGIFLLQDGGGLVKLTEHEYEAEDRLQALLADYPDLLAGEQINSAFPRRWLHIKREAGIPAAEGSSDRWALDHLYLDQDAIPTFVEVKRSSNTEIRRKVVGQMLDYAANATRYWPVDQMREQFALACTARQEDSAAVLGELLGLDADIEQFWDLARRNLRDGRVRLLFVADLIPPELRSIVEFLNRQMSPAEVLAVEIRQYVGGSPERPLRTLVPRVIGQTEAAKQAKDTESSAPLVTSESELLDRWPEATRSVARAMLEAGRTQGYDVRVHTTRLKNQYFRIVVPTSGAVPFTLDRQYLWVSLGRHLPQLREPSVNQEVRQRLAAFVPGLPQVADPKKVEIGVSLMQNNLPLAFDPDRFAELARFVADALR